MHRVATCHCARIEVRCEEEPVKVSMCHCLDCQRRTGSLFSVAAFYPRAAFSVARGEAARFARPSASGFEVTFNFCPACGTNLWWEPERLPHLVGIAVGALGDPSFPPPEQAVWAVDRHEWLALPPEMPVHERNPPPRR